ncbi:hypothetical protein JTB14_036365 [Gonioctena quinquepunctata]|nr:hypothetical protein JTB14_036365 [Gonioctena quinquepunctata]
MNAEETNTISDDVYYTYLNQHKLKNKLKQENWLAVYQGNDPNLGFNSFSNILSEHIANCSQTKKGIKRKTDNKLKPWMIQALLNSIRGGGKGIFKEHSFWSFNIFSSNHKTFELHPFYTNCFGIETSETYSAHIDVIRIDFWKLLLLLFGVLTFLTADKMSRNNIFHYICGITLGMSASILILVYFVSRIFPKKSFMYGILGCGWTVAIYGLQLLWGNLQSILVLYKFYIIWYIIATGLVSFIACYRWGPVVNPRTLNLISIMKLLWFKFSYYSFVIIFQLDSNCKTYWRRRSPPKIKLLTEEEYYQQGVEETSKALNELRKYCSSPECNQWKTVRKLKDVKKFASFIEGDSHVTEEEIFDYESSLTTFIEGGDILDEDD